MVKDNKLINFVIDHNGISETQKYLNEYKTNALNLRQTC